MLGFWASQIGTMFNISILRATCFAVTTTPTRASWSLAYQQLLIFQILFSLSSQFLLIQNDPWVSNLGGLTTPPLKHETLLKSAQVLRNINIGFDSLNHKHDFWPRPRRQNKTTKTCKFI